jgi:hypothetical protein
VEKPRAPFPRYRLFRPACFLVTMIGIAQPVFGTSDAPALWGKVVLEETADYRCTYPNNFVDIVKGSGSIPLVLPKEGGAIKGQGTFTHQGTGYSFAGPLILDGTLQDGRLTFPFPKGYSDGIQVYNRNNPVSILARRDAVTVLDHSSFWGVGCTGTITWRLTKPVEKWRVTVDDEGENATLTGSGKFHQAGLRVHARRIVDVTIEKGAFKQASGTASLVAMQGYSKPPGFYTCQPASIGIVGTGSDIDFERLDQAKWAARFHPPKTPADEALKAQWEKIKKHNTPVIYPEKFSAGGQVSGQSLDLILPADSGYTVGIYCRLTGSSAIGAPSSRRKEVISTERNSLLNSFQVQLVDGWQHHESWSTATTGLPQTSGTTDFQVQLIE